MKRRKPSYRIHRLGHRAFLLFLSKRIRGVLLLFVLTGAVWYAVRWAPEAYAIWVLYIAKLFLLISIAYLAMVVLRTYLEYHSHTYAFTKEAFVVTSGYWARNEVATLYHHIQNVNIERRPFDRVSGTSNIIVLLTGGHRESAHNRITLPAVGNRKARWVQKKLLVLARRHAAEATETQREL